MRRDIEVGEEAEEERWGDTHKAEKALGNWERTHNNNKNNENKAHKNTRI